MKSHGFEVCRCLYAQARERGAPSVVVVDMGGGFVVVETKDGKVRHETVLDCCRWAAKYNAAREWLDLFGTNTDS